VLQLYGTPTGNPQDPWLKLPDGRYSLSIKCMTEYDYFCSQFDSNNKLHAMIKAKGIAAAAAGKLN